MILFHPCHLRNPRLKVLFDGSAEFICMRLRPGIEKITGSQGSGEPFGHFKPELQESRAGRTYRFIPFETTTLHTLHFKLAAQGGCQISSFPGVPVWRQCRQLVIGQSLVGKLMTVEIAVIQKSRAGIGGNVELNPAASRLIDSACSIRQAQRQEAEDPAVSTN